MRRGGRRSWLRMLMALPGTIVRGIAIIFIWGAAIYALNTVFVTESIRPGTFGFSPWTFMPTIVVAVILGTGAISLSKWLWRGRLSVTAAAQPDFVPRRDAVSPSALSTRDLINLLGEDDLDDLRDEVRETLRDRVRRLNLEDDPATFEALLSSSKAKRKR